MATVNQTATVDLDSDDIKRALIEYAEQQADFADFQFVDIQLSDGQTVEVGSLSAHVS